MSASEISSPRRDAILEAAIGVFLRYGFKKTSMVDLARAAGLSRQGLYLHFATKEALFKDSVLRLIASLRTSARTALGRDELGVERRIQGAFDAIHGEAIGQIQTEHMDDLLEASIQLIGPVVAEMEQGLILEIARVLRTSGVSARWTSAGLSAKDLAANLYETSAGLKHRVKTFAEYHAGMGKALRIVCRGAAL